MDLKKAFDTAVHHILLQKLEHYGIRGVANEWFSSYLKNRAQFVSIGNVSSTIKELLTGVPQGLVIFRSELVIFRSRKLKIHSSFKFKLEDKRLVPTKSVK